MHRLAGHQGAEHVLAQLVWEAALAAPELSALKSPTSAMMVRKIHCNRFGR